MHWVNDGMGTGFVDFLGIGEYGMLAFAPLLLWSLVWKGWALWLAARRGELVWFLVLLIINTVGILEIVYIFLVAKRQESEEEPGKAVDQGPQLPQRRDHI